MFVPIQHQMLYLIKVVDCARDPGVIHDTTIISSAEISVIGMTMDQYGTSEIFRFELHQRRHAHLPSPRFEEFTHGQVPLFAKVIFAGLLFCHATVAGGDQLTCTKSDGLINQ